MRLAACEVHESSLCLDDVVECWVVFLVADVAIARHRAINEFRVVLLESIVVNMQLIGDSRYKVLQNDIRLLDKAVQNLPTFRLLEVQSYAFLVAVDRLEVG